MKFPWLYINRNSNKSRLIIPGWSILPSYFAKLIPQDNLIILNPFIHSQDIKLYCDTNLNKDDVHLMKLALNDDLITSVNKILIFSMGLQWFDTHAQEFYQYPCDIISPASSYKKT